MSGREHLCWWADRQGGCNQSIALVDWVSQHTQAVAHCSMCQTLGMVIMGTASYLSDKALQPTGACQS
jgi:hypothetical protein